GSTEQGESEPRAPEAQQNDNEYFLHRRALLSNTLLGHGGPRAQRELSGTVRVRQDQAGNIPETAASSHPPASASRKTNPSLPPAPNPRWPCLAPRGRIAVTRSLGTHPRAPRRRPCSLPTTTTPATSTPTATSPSATRRGPVRTATPPSSRTPSVAPS